MGVTLDIRVHGRRSTLAVNTAQEHNPYWWQC